MFPGWFILRSVPSCLVGIFSSLGLENSETYLPEKGVLHQSKVFSASRRLFSVLSVIRQKCLCLMFVPSLVASNVFELSSEHFNFSIPFLSKAAPASWIWSALLPGHCSGWGSRDFHSPLALPKFFHIEQDWTSPAGDHVGPVPFICAHLFLDKVGICYDTWHSNLRASSYWCFS